MMSKMNKAGKGKKYDRLAEVINNNADVLRRVERNGIRTSKRLGMWVFIGVCFGYFVESQISNLDSRLRRIERERDNVVECEEWNDTEG